MFKTQWRLMDNWIVENKHRIIFKPQDGGFSLIDITIDCKNINEIIYKVEKEVWTKEELMDYLNRGQNYEFCKLS